MVERGVRAAPARRWRVSVFAGTAALALTTMLAPVAYLSAQTLNERLARTARGDGKSPMVVDADQLIYDNDRNRVTAVGNVQLYQKGKVLQADRVTYDRNTNRVFAEGNVKLTDENGAVTRATKFEITDDFKDGFIESFRYEQRTVKDGKAVTARFSAPFAERAGGETTTFVKGTYTTCDPCEKDPERPPFWRVRAKKIIHNNSERTIYYEDATLELFGRPIAWLPYFSSPDPTVKRKTGFLAPKYVASTVMGTGISVPFFWELAPNYDLTFTPTLLSRQGLLGEVEWRHRVMNGAYSVRAAGIVQQDQSAFSFPPFGPRGEDFRGAVESHGRFYINERWYWGWDGMIQSDRWFADHYRFKSGTIERDATYSFFRESTSTIYLTGKGDWSWFDLRGYHFQGLSVSDFQSQQPIIHPVWDYNRRFAGPAFLGGELGVDLNFVSLSRDTAQYAEIPRQKTFLVNGVNAVGEPFALYDGCAVYAKNQCLVRGISGSVNRLSANVTWRRNFIDPLGQVWTPYGSLRVDAFAVAPDVNGTFNAPLANFLTGDDQTFARAIPALGLIYRYPFVGISGGLTHTLEPIAQVVARPSETRIGLLPNEDSQSLVFDDTNLFAWNRFSGYDRVEGGIRASYGGRYTVAAASGAYASLLFGQQVHLAGVNSFVQGDLANVGIGSGLDRKRSDFVGSVQIAPNSTYSFIARGRFDEVDFSPQRLEAQLRADFGTVQTSLLYARYDAQPQIGFPFRREGLLGQAGVKLSPNWQLNGSVLLDLDRYLQDRAKFDDDKAAGLIPAAAVFKKRTIVPAAMSLGIKYEDECTIFGVQYIAAYKDGADGTRTPTQTLLLRLELKSLGETSVRQSLAGSGLRQDGIQQ